MEEQYYPLNNEGDVINLLENPDEFFINRSMTKFEYFFQKLKEKVLHIKDNDWNKQDNWVINRKKWIYDGVNAEVLHIGSSSWKQGKIRIKVTVEFCPDTPDIPESPLDDIRKNF